MNLRIRTCGQCGAVVAVISSWTGEIDNEQQHREWHERLAAELLKQVGALSQRRMIQPQEGK